MAKAVVVGARLPLARLEGQGDKAMHLYETAVRGCPTDDYEGLAAKAALHELAP